MNYYLIVASLSNLLFIHTFCKQQINLRYQYKKTKEKLNKLETHDVISNLCAYCTPVLTRIIKYYYLIVTSLGILTPLRKQQINHIVLITKTLKKGEKERRHNHVI